MKMNFRPFKRLLGGILSAAVVLSSLGSASVAFAATDDDNAVFSSCGTNVYGQYKDVDQIFNQVGEALCHGETYVFKNVKENGSWKRELCESSMGINSDPQNSLHFLSDNQYAPVVSSGNNHYMSSIRNLFIDTAADGTISKYYLDGSERYVDIVQDFGKVANVKNVILMNHPNTMLRTGHYLVYLSETAETLYNKENLIYEFHDNRNPHLAQKITLKTPVSARYLGVKIYNPYTTDIEKDLLADQTTSNPSHCYIRLMELNAYGTNTSQRTSRTSQTPDVFYSIRENTSIIKGLTPTNAYSVANDDLTTKKDLVISSAKDAKTGNDVEKSFSALTDDNLNTYITVKGANEEHSFLKSGQSTIDVGEDKLYHQINYYLGGTLRFSSFNFYSPTSFFRAPYAYRFSIADSEADLFTDNAYSSEVIYNQNTSIATKIAAPKTGAYFGLRIISPSYPNNRFVCPTISGKYKNFKPSNEWTLGELEITGIFTEPSKPVTVNNAIITNEGTFTIPSDATVSYSGIRDNNGKYSRSATVNASARSMASFSSKKYYFVGWSTTSDKTGLITTDIAYSDNVTIGTLYAIYDSVTPTKKVTFTFYDKAGNIIATKQVLRGYCLTSEDYDEINAAVPQIAGYKHKTALVSFGSQQKEMPMWNKALYGVEAAIDCEFKPVYEAADTTYNVTVNGAAVNTDGCRFDERITLAESTNGWTVNGIDWVGKNGGATYVVGDMEIKTADKAVTAELSLYAEGASSASLSGGKMTFFAKQNLPQNAKIIERGLLVMGSSYLLVSDYKDGTYSKLTLDGNPQIKITSATTDSEHFAVSLTGVARKQTRVARAYCKYTVGSVTKVAYSNVAVLQMK